SRFAVGTDCQSDGASEPSSKGFPFTTRLARDGRPAPQPARLPEARGRRALQHTDRASGAPPLSRQRHSNVSTGACAATTGKVARAAPLCLSPESQERRERTRSCSRYIEKS